MDGILRLLDERDAPAEQPPLLSILYAEDFDEPAAAEMLADAAVEPPPPALTREDLDRACAAAVQQARSEWEHEGAQQRLRRLRSLEAALADAAAAAERVALAATEGTVATMLSMLSGALPHFCREHGPAEARALVAKLLPALRSEPRITIRVHPELVAEVQEDVAALDPDLAAAVTVLAAPIAPGDLKVAWEAGRFSRESAHILQAMEGALGRLGLAPLAASSERSLAHAE